MDEKSFRRELRKSSTPAEARLWSVLRNRQLMNRKFRRQHSIGNYIVDFFCFDEKLVVEVDGNSHNDVGSQQYDFERDSWLKSEGYKVLRFDNRELLENIERVLLEIEKHFTSP